MVIHTCARPLKFKNAHIPIPAKLSNTKVTPGLPTFKVLRKLYFGCISRWNFLGFPVEFHTQYISPGESLNRAYMLVGHSTTRSAICIDCICPGCQAHYNFSSISSNGRSICARAHIRCSHALSSTNYFRHILVKSCSIWVISFNKAALNAYQY